MQKNIVLLLLSFVVGAGTGFAEVAIPYGTGAGKVAFLSQENDPVIGECVALGPKSFRSLGGEVWIADSVGGRILGFGEQGNPTHEIPLPETEGGFIEDFALVVDPKGNLDSILVLDSNQGGVQRVSPEGKARKNLCNGFFVPSRIEVSAQGNFAVGDLAQQALFLHGPDGSLLRKREWEVSGFCFDPQGNLCLLELDATSGVNHLVVETVDGKHLRRVPIPLGDHEDLQLWEVSDTGEVTLTFAKPGEADDKKEIHRFDAAGKLLKKDRLPRHGDIPRFLVRNPRGGWFLGICHFKDAPAGSFRITDFPF